MQKSQKNIKFGTFFGYIISKKRFEIQSYSFLSLKAINISFTLAMM